jgi:hypothetical protein
MEQYALGSHLLLGPHHCFPFGKLVTTYLKNEEHSNLEVMEMERRGHANSSYCSLFVPYCVVAYIVIFPKGISKRVAYNIFKII